MSVTEIPTLGFARGSVVQRKDGGPNMLVVRGYRDRTVVVVITGDEDGNLRLADMKNTELKELLPARTPGRI